MSHGWFFYALHLIAVALIVSCVIPFFIMGWKSIKHGREHPIFRYFGLVQVALFVSVFDGAFVFWRLFGNLGLSFFDDLEASHYAFFVVQIFVSITLWMLCIYLMRSNKPKK